MLFVFTFYKFYYRFRILLFIWVISKRFFLCYSIFSITNIETTTIFFIFISTRTRRYTLHIRRILYCIYNIYTKGIEQEFKRNNRNRQQRQHKICLCFTRSFALSSSYIHMHIKHYIILYKYILYTRSEVGQRYPFGSWHYAWLKRLVQSIFLSINT